MALTDVTNSVPGQVAGVGDYVSLLKPRVMSLVLFTALGGMVVAPGQMHPVIAMCALLCIAVGAGASGALNMWYDADIDRKMARTRSRAVPSGRIPAEEALTLGVTLSLLSVLILALATNYLAAALLAVTIGFYVLIYTMFLKRRTPQNIVIGGAAGALPPVVGWAAASGSLSFEPWILFAIIFMWTPPHFWALGLYKSADYERAGIPMMPVVRGEKSTRLQILVYSLLLMPITLLPFLVGMAGGLYGVIATVSGLIFVSLCGVLWKAASLEDARKVWAPRVFAFSIFYLFILFAALLVERATGLV